MSNPKCSESMHDWQPSATHEDEEVCKWCGLTRPYSASDPMPDVAKAVEKSGANKKGDKFDWWKCLTCEGQPEFERPAMMKHLQEVHHIDTKTAKGTRMMKSHIDARTWFQTDYELEFEGVKMTNMVRQPRAKNDMMRFV